MDMREAFTAAYMEACKGRPADHNEIGFHYAWALWKAATEYERERIASQIERLRNAHCADTAKGDPMFACTPDGLGCDFVAAWNDAIDIARMRIRSKEQRQ